ncbi:type III pantothenate kinase [Mangrovibacterium diazotrophicum]|uniref:Type III pantothenate kinase n=1 Tax=Mangrovibacterium diazotrophicum TaxID=1261403 RepID=A0A419VVN3_9BACT|nr:type III pantothenate kinase [Mangrovibacterium diazotrophicum]RKD86062.1 type III pantothenate kinase [Mangrovibacterium diazotrophicum]
MNLVIDIGNTRVKWALFRDRELVTQDSAPELTLHVLGQIIGDFHDVKLAILSSVKEFPKECRDLLTEVTDLFIELNHNTPTPIVNRYRTPETLGLDRLAAAIGASTAFPGDPLLIIDAGTAITIDLVSPANEYLGGNISPGIETRFRALNQFTGKLPLIQLKNDFEPLGGDTESAIRAGVQQGVIFELESYIAHYKKVYPELVVVLTGGHSNFLMKHIGAELKQIENLTLTGLLEILMFNAS